MPRKPKKRVGRKKGYRRFIGRKPKHHTLLDGKITAKKDDYLQEETENQAEESRSQDSMEEDSLAFHGFRSIDVKTPIRVLSLFDGLSIGRHCLDKLNIVVQCYFSSEVDEKALKLQRYNFGDRVIPLGCVKSLTKDVLRSLGKIDLLLAAPPCQDFSLANPRRLNFEGENGSLFLEFPRILKDLREINKESNTKLFFLCENVRSMEKETRAAITRALGCDPQVHNAKKYGYMKRARLFWTNLPQEEHDSDSDDSDDSASGRLGDILSCQRKANVKILPTLTTTYHSQITGKRDQKLPVVEDGQEQALLIVEKERAFGLPTSFTDGADLSINDRSKLIGRAWCAKTIADIFKPLTNIFKTHD